jgi:hypothetical protein
VSQVVLVVALVVSLLAAAWLYAYKLRQPYTKADLVKARRESVDKSRSVVSGKMHLLPLGPRTPQSQAYAWAMFRPDGVPPTSKVALPSLTSAGSAKGFGQRASQVN